MSEAESFHEKIANLKPTDQDTKPNTIWVGILRHTKNASDELMQIDCLWVKCGKNKDVSKIRKAYISVAAPGEDIILRHAFQTAGFKPIEDHVLVSSMNTHGDDVVALDAIRKSDLASRMVKEERVPLQKITNPAAASKSIPMDVKAEAREPSTSTPLLAPETARSTLDSTAAFEASQSMEWAWIDFHCERRELLLRIKHRSTRQEVMEMNETIMAEWLQLTQGQIKVFENRAHRIAATLYGPGTTDTERFVSTSRAFWLYYCTEFYREKRAGNDPHRTLETSQSFFDHSLTLWLEPRWWSIRNQYVDVNLAYMERHPIPKMPQGLARSPDVPAARLKRDLSSPASNNSSESFERMAIPSVKRQEDDPESPCRSPESPEDEQPAYNRPKIPDLFTDCTPEQLEKGVERGVTVLNRLRTTLTLKEDIEADEAGQWLKSIENVQKQAVRTRTVIGVVGNTGAGKSSVINALLDEERLLPTNCMRACTAVITEISYNYDSTAYTAEIEFISEKDWIVELETLFKDLLDGTGNVSRDCTNEDCEAGIAYAKIKAVYPKLTKEDISNSSVDELMQYGNVSRLLGASRSLKETDSFLFYKKLQSFVDSKEKTIKSEKEKSDREKSKPREMEFWPLIKVVRLFVRAPALSTGAVIVDLPGVHDSNQARAAVAQNYMKQCTGLWICAPINRAVDDKAAKSLLGETFKRQLKMDGGYSTVTFICSKTDDISLMEAQDSLGIEDELAELWNKCDELSKKKQTLKKELDDLKETKTDYSQVMEAADEELEVWERLKDDFDEGKPVYQPSLKTKGGEKKRKRGRPKELFAKRARLDDSDDDFVNYSSHSEGNDAHDEESDISSEHEEPAERLAEEKILEKIGNLRATKKDGRQHRAQIDDVIKDVRRQMQEVEKELDAVEAIISQKCIQGRNQYSKGAIQQDFAAGIKELDMEIQEEEDAANFNPDNEVRDYDEVARSLPVFTVSSRAYQKLKGRLIKDKDVPGFTTVEETQIPQLQEHAKRTTEAGRQANCRRFLNSMSQLLNSLKLWASSDGSSSNLTEIQKSQEANFLKDKLGTLDKDLEKEIDALCNSLMEEVQENIFDHFSIAVQQAASEAPNTAQRWGMKVNRDDRAAGGLYWATYKAVCRRDGVFSNSQGLHDWNSQLTEPIIKNIASGWERAFSRRMPSVLNALANTNGTLLTAFHNTVETRAVRNGTSLASLEMLKQQLPTYKDTFRDLSAVAQAQISTRQRDINREFVPVVAEAMKQAYDDCESEIGPGQYVRMKTMMSRHVEGVRRQMFHDSTNAVKKSLKKLIKDIKNFLLVKADEVFMSVKRDYESVVLGRQAASHQLPREQRQIRADVNDIVEGTELIFKKVVGLAPETPEPEECEPVIEASGGNEASPKTEGLEQDKAMEGFEKVNESNTDIISDANVDVGQTMEGTIAVEQTARIVTEQAKVDPESKTTASALTHLPSLMATNQLSANHPAAGGPVDLQKPDSHPLAESSNIINVPETAAEKKPSPEESGKENILQNPLCVSSDDGEPASDLETNERGFGHSPSSVASWVQSWFAPRD